MNSLTRQAGIQLGPLLLETLVKHYFDRLVKEDETQGRVMTKLRQEELLYDEAFNVVKVYAHSKSPHPHLNRMLLDVPRSLNQVSTAT